ncbi:glycoside hydrolase family 97 N-terminal domain-containing protein, partial [Pedobacter sp.]|uniref:glycoside hydrolase family 97 N-terminal domain-containing protein n=1 Tax=Pedobacter sp. TaxID=1411316 RepID=UPI003D7FC815
MKNFLIAPLLCFFFLSGFAQDAFLLSPDKQLKVNLLIADGKPMYSVIYKGKMLLENSPLGLLTNEGDFSTGVKYVSMVESTVSKDYAQDRIKKSNISYRANKLIFTLQNADKKAISIVFQVSNNDIAYRYELPAWAPTMSCIIEKEATGFKFPATTTTFLSPMMRPMTGFARTAPSYESAYTADALMNTNNQNEGYVFPGLFHVDNKYWILISETGVNGQYCASHLSSYSKDNVFTIEYPNIKQNNGFGSSGAAVALPGITPWRTITVGDHLKPIVETTIPFDVVEPLYEASQPYKFGRATWSWIVWQDNSMNYDDQVKYIDLAADLKYEYILMDALWDTNIGKERMSELVKYANSKGVNVFLWYNSNGQFNDAPQGPRNKMNTAVERKKEMKWLRDIGV